MPREGAAASVAVAVARYALDVAGGAGTVVLIARGVPAVEEGAFAQVMHNIRHAVLVLATGPGPFDGAPGVTVMEAMPDDSDVARVAARAQHHFAAAVALGAQPASAAEGDWLWRLRLTPDQRARLLLERGDAARAAALFSDPVWRGVALHRAGDCEAAAAAFALRDHSEAQCNRGNALMMRPQGWNDALPAHDRALQLRPDFPEARDNLAIAEVFRRQQQAEAQRAVNQTDDAFARPPDPNQTVADLPPQPEQQRDSHDLRPGWQPGLDQALTDAQRQGWTLVSMRQDWVRVFPER